MNRTSNRLVQSAHSGGHHSAFRGQGLEFDAVREYVPGDDIRNIDWKVTARTGAPHLKLFKEERERSTIICVDMNTGMRFGTRKTFKSVQAAQIAALLGWQSLAHHDNVSTCLFGDVSDGIQFHSSKRSRKSFCTMLKTLSEPFSDRIEVSLTQALEAICKRAQTGSVIYIVSDFLHFDSDSSLQTYADDHIGLETILGRLSKKCDVVFISVSDQADQNLCPVGVLGFCSNETEKHYVDTDNITGREKYAAQWVDNRAQLRALATKFKTPLVELTTESEIRKDLILGLKSVSKRKKR